MIFDVTVLLLAVLAYGVATLLLADGSTSGVRAALTHRRWLAGVAVQVVAFVLAFLSRRDLPLLVVQPATTASIAVTCVLGAVLGRWALTRRDGFALTLVVASVAGLAVCASPGPARMPGSVPLVVLAVAVGLSALEALRSVRRHAPVGPAALWVGAGSGLAFGVGAVGARALAADPVGTVRTVPGVLALALLGAGTLLGQLLLTAAISGGAVAGPTTAMHVVQTVGPAVVGVVWLGDAVVAGRAPLALACTAVALVGTVLLVGHGTAPAGDATATVPHARGPAAGL